MAIRRAARCRSGLPEAAVALLATLPGCGDPWVSIRFEIPAPYRAEARTVRLSVLEPPPAEPFDCDAITFGSVSDDALRLSTTLVVAAEAGESDRPLSQLPRQGRKLFFAEAADGDGKRLVASCAEVGDVEEAMEVVLEGEPAAVAKTGMIAKNSSGVPTNVELTMTDALGSPLAGREARWIVAGPGDKSEAGHALTDARGAVSLEPRPAQLAGPTRVDLRVRWAQRPIPPLRYFQPPKRTLHWKDKVVGDHGARDGVLVGRIGPTGEPGFAAVVLNPHPEPKCDCVKNPMCAANCTVLGVWYDGLEIAGTDAPRRYVTLPLSLGAATILPGSTADRLVARSADAWFELSYNGAVMDLIATPAQDPRLSPPNSMVAAGGCDPAGPEPSLLVRYGTGEVVAYTNETPQDPDALTELAGQAALGARLLDAGCVGGTDGVARPVIVVGDANNAVTLVTRWSDGPRALATDTVRSLVGFARSVGGGPPLLLTDTIDIDGVWLTRSRIAPTGASGLELEQVDRDRSTLLAGSPVGGDFDNDGQLDVAAMLVGEQNDDGEFKQAIFVALGADRPGDRLVAKEDVETSPPRALWVMDFDEDGYDDILVAEPDAVTLVFLGESVSNF